MKKGFGLALTIAFMFFLAAQANQACAQSHYYMGIAGNYASSNLGGKFDGGGSVGINFRSGTYYRDWFSAELNIDYMPEFKDDSSVEISGDEVDADFDMEVLTFLINAKFTPDIGARSLRPIIFIGGGYMVTKASSSPETSSYLNSRSLDGSGFCGNLGLGLEYLVSETYSFDLKGSYNKGFSDVSDVKYLLFALGVSYHF